MKSAPRNEMIKTLILLSNCSEMSVYLTLTENTGNNNKK